MADTYPTPEHGWTCFHCGETFTDYCAALTHFGIDPMADRAGCVEKLTAKDQSLLKKLRKAESRAHLLLRDNVRLEDESLQATLARKRTMGAENERLRVGISDLRAAIHACNRNPIPNSRRIRWRDLCDLLLAARETPDG